MQILGSARLKLIANIASILSPPRRWKSWEKLCSAARMIENFIWGGVLEA